MIMEEICHGCFPRPGLCRQKAHQHVLPVWWGTSVGPPLHREGQHAGIAEITTGEPPCTERKLTTLSAT